MSRHYKFLSYSALFGGLFALNGCIVTPDSNHSYNNGNSGYSQTQHSNSHQTNNYNAASNSAAWDRGCADAEAGSYDRSGNAGPGYEEGWQSCNKHAKQQNANKADSERNRGCEDAKNGSYDRSGNAGPTYEEGWQACKKQQSGGRPGTVDDAKRICTEMLGGSVHIQTISALKPGFWEIIMMDNSGRKVACTADTANDNVADWVEM